MRKEEMSKSNQTAGPVAVLTPCSNSHPFEERRISVPSGEDQALKIGRAVARITSAPSNAIFDCKVLSRNHAVLWYSAEEGEFFIRDVKSSNGTFINNERLSNSGEESAPRPLRSGDIVQLGVEIIDNAKKVASGCITSIVRLYNERGEECVEHASGAGQAAVPILMRSEHIPMKYTLVRNDKMFVMEQYIKEARFREGMLGQKLQQLEEQLEGAQEALKTSWQALINEEQLLSRIEILESQLALFNSKNPTPDGLRKEIQLIHEDRAKAELTAKETLRKAEEQLFETNCRLSEAENGLVNLEKDNDALRTRCSDFEQALVRERGDHEELLIKYNDLLFNYNALEKSVRAMAAATAAAAAAATAAAEKETSSDGSQTGPEQEISILAEEGGTEFKVSRVNDQSSSRLNDEELDTPPEPPYIIGGGHRCNIRLRLAELVNSPEWKVGSGTEDEVALLTSVRRLLEGTNAFDGKDWRTRQLRDLATPSAGRIESLADGQVLLLSTFPLLLFILILLFPLMRVSDVLAATVTNPPAAQQQSTDESLEESTTEEDTKESPQAHSDVS